MPGSADDVQATDSSSNQNRTLYVGNLHPYVTEAMLQDIFATLGAVAEVKIIKDRVTQMSAGYGFVRFVDWRAAELAIQSIHGRVLYGQEVRCNWAFQKNQKEDTSQHFHIFVGDLGSEVTDRMLLQAFSQLVPCSDARVMWDHSTGRSRGYGFVSFRTRPEADAAIQQMNGEQIGTRRVRCGWAQHKQDQTQPMVSETVDKADPSNTNVYVGNVGPEVTDADLRNGFAGYGNVLEIKQYRKGSYAFVRFEKHSEAVAAIVGMSGQNLAGRTVKCSWGRHQTATGSVAPTMMMGLSPAMAGMLPHQAMLGSPGIQPMLMSQMTGNPMASTQLLMANPAAMAGAQSQHPQGPGQHGMPLDPSSMYYGIPPSMYFRSM